MITENMFWIPNLCWDDRKATLLWETWRTHFFMVLWYGRSCKEMRGQIIKQLNSYTKSQHHALMTITSKKTNWNPWETCQKGALKLFWNAYTWHVLDESIFPWSVNKFARSITKWTKACDKRLARLISYIHHTCEFKQYCHVGNTAQQRTLGLFQDSDFAGDLEDSKSTSGGTLCIFGSHTFVPISWMCKKQSAVSHSSTESEIISLDTGLRLDGLPALELWDLIVSVLGNVSRVSDGSGQPDKWCSQAPQVSE